MKKTFSLLIFLACSLGITACSQPKKECKNGCGVANHRVCPCGCTGNSEMDGCRCDAQCSCKNLTPN